jgi:hypothetical protein
MPHPAVGVTGPKFEFVVELGKLREFARATSASHEEYLSSPNPVVPPTFLTIAGRFWGYTFDEPGDTPLADIPFDRSMLLNAEEEFEFPGPLPRAGMKLWAQTRIVDVYEKQGRRGGALTFIVAETVFKSDVGELVARQKQTVVKTEKAPDKQ